MKDAETDESRNDRGATEPAQPESSGAFSRRAFLRGASGVTATGLVGAHVFPDQAPAEGEASGPPAPSIAGTTMIELTVNGESRRVSVEPRTTLLSALRDRMEPAMTGSKLVCDRGNCGACTVLIDGEPAVSCLQLAVDCVGRQVTTIEGLGRGDELSPLQESFVEEDGLMCGFCTPGFVMSIHACLERNPAASLDEVKSACSGNVCRCGTYPHIFNAAMSTVAKLRGDR